VKLVAAQLFALVKKKIVRVDPGLNVSVPLRSRDMLDGER
jgi:hypothetical protein